MDVLGQSLALRRRPLQYWPRRLLHIPTMWSYEKRAGNTYGLQDPVTEPPYATLSYTWARYVRRKSAPTSSIRIGGIDWDTPDIEPNHFTPQRFLQVIHNIRKISRLDYVWIDIACINIERIPDDDLDPEIPMQQDIFFDAAASFIWLCRTEQSCMFHLAKVLTDASLLNDAKTIPALLQVMSDPWFSSLWTLLEAAVRTDAVILSSDCSATTVDREKLDPVLFNEPKAIRFARETSESVDFELKSSEPTFLARVNAQSPATSRSFTLRDLICLVKHVMELIPSGDARDMFHEAANKSGLLSFEPFNLLSLYGSAQYRHEMKPGLRMKYVHNQIFGFDGFRGDSALLQAEDHFNSRLIQQYPVLSQLFIRQTPLQTGSSWRLTSRCKILDIQFFVAYASSYECLFTLRLEESPQIDQKDKSSTVFFRGPTSEFRKMASEWLDNVRYQSNRLLGISFDQCNVSRRDGSTVEIGTSVVFPTPSPGGYTLSETSQRDCVGAFLDSLGDLEARVLAMAAGSGILPGCRVGVGLIIIPQHCGAGVKLWQRVGVCFWAFQESEENREESGRAGGLRLSEGTWEITEGRSVN